MIRYKDDGSVDVATSPFTNLEVAELANHLDRAVAALLAKEQECEALRKDAERYRFMRERGAGIEVADDTYPDQKVDLWLGTTALDKEVDDAIARAALDQHKDQTS